MLASFGGVLVTGGAGFIGSSLARASAAAANRWVVFDNLHRQVHSSPAWPRSLPPGVERIQGDVTHAQEWDELLSDFRPDIVVHLAAETGTAQSLSVGSRHANVNVVGTTEMLDAFGRASHRPTHLVLASSRAVYGEGTWLAADGTTFAPRLRTHAELVAGRWDHRLGDLSARHLPNRADETIPSPTSIYAATKLAQEHILASWAGAHDVPFTVLRLQNVYGPGQSLTNSYTGIVPLFARIAREGKVIPLYEDGEITRDFVFIDDVVAAIVSALRIPPDVHRVVDVGTGVRTTIRDLAAVVARLHGAPDPVVTGQFRDGDVRHAACTVEAATAQLGWAPRWSLDEGVARLQQWIDEAC